MEWRKVKTIEVPREKCPNLYSFTDVYVHPKGATIDESRKLLTRWEDDVVSILTFLPVYSLFEDKIREEVFDVLFGDEDFSRLYKELDLSDSAEKDDDHITFTSLLNRKVKVEVYPRLELEKEGYKILLSVYVFKPPPSSQA